MYDFKGKTALVTGAARGIGRAIALELARGGANLALNDVNEAAAKEAVELALQAAVDSVVQAFGGLHVLVNNAGISIDALLMRLKDEDWKKTLDINLTGAFNLMRAASRPMMKQRAGSIVNIASVVGEMGRSEER